MVLTLKKIILNSLLYYAYNANLYSIKKLKKKRVDQWTRYTIHSVSNYDLSQQIMIIEVIDLRMMQGEQM